MNLNQSGVLWYPMGIVRNATGIQQNAIEVYRSSTESHRHPIEYDVCYGTLKNLREINESGRIRSPLVSYGNRKEC